MLGEAILNLFSRPVQTASLNPSRHEWTVETALNKAVQTFPGFVQQMQGKVVVDYGSGLGYQSVALARAGARHVYALDPWDLAVTRASELVERLGEGGRVSVIAAPEGLAGTVDAVLCQNSFEHFPDPARELNAMASLLAPGGRLYLCFGPPWFAPHGSHMNYFCKLPWINLLFAESTVMKVRARYRNDGAQRYEDVPGGLNGMSIAKWESLVAASGLQVIYSHYSAIKKLPLLASLPLIRELAINDVAAVLTKPA